MEVEANATIFPDLLSTFGAMKKAGETFLLLQLLCGSYAYYACIHSSHSLPGSIEDTMCLSSNVLEDFLLLKYS